MADNTTINTTPVDAEIENDEEETILNEDIVEGSALGLVGGAIVGGLAGGPIGAVVGAVVGGIASAFGVAEVDRHNHEHEAAIEAVDATTIKANAADAKAIEPAREPVSAYIPSTVETITPVEVNPVPIATIVSPALADAAPTTVEAVDTVALDKNAIRLRAYQLYDLRGREDGKALQDWLTAEKEYITATA